MKIISAMVKLWKRENKMTLKLMYITNDSKVATIAEKAGVDRIFIDMEFIGKDARQGGLDTVKNHHTIEDIVNVKNAIKKSDLLVRVNPIHDEIFGYMSSEVEINKAIEAGADIIMLPFFKTTDEVKRFIEIVNGRCRTMLLIETPEAVEELDDILLVNGIDEIHIGLNDLHLGLGKKFMFELLADGTVDRICNKIKQVGIPFGFGGIARVGEGALPSEMIIAEHYRIGSTMAILSRSFCDVKIEKNYSIINDVFEKGVSEIRDYEKKLTQKNPSFFINNKYAVKEIVEQIINRTLAGEGK